MTSTETLADIVKHLQWSRYLEAAGLVVLLFDHLLLLQDEVEYLWASRWTYYVKYLFLWIRYGVPLCILLHTHQLSGIGNSELSDTLLLGQITVGCGNVLVLTHLWALWGKDRRMVIGTLSLFAATLVANLVCTGIAIRPLNDAASFSHLLGSCVISERGKAPILWAPSLVFDVTVLSLVIYNALDRPRGEHTAITRVLYRDGIGYLLLLLALRLANLLLAIVAPVSLIFLGIFFIWSSTTVTVTRFTLNLMKLEAREKMERMPISLR